MQELHVSLSRTGRLAALITALILATVAVSGAQAISTGSGGRFAPANVIVHPTHVRTTATSAGGDASVLFSCQLPGASPRCFGPRQIRAAYGVSLLLLGGTTGAGRTIVIVDAFQNPYLASDLQIFDQTWGLPAANLTILNPFGAPAFDITNADEVGWSGESSLDVQVAHAMAPGAAIVMVEARSDSDQDILNATRYAINNSLGDVLSQSYGEGESCVNPLIESLQHQLFVHATQDLHMTVFAASGDDGAAQPDCSGTGQFKSASSPASDPDVTAVGATTLFANQRTGLYQSETAWGNDPFVGSCDTAALGCSGGGFSNIYTRPAYQVGVPGTQAGHRGVPDVSLNGGVDGGVLIHWGVGDIAIAGDPLGGTDPGSAWIFGGTSVATPEWAALGALADGMAGHRLGNINPALYSLQGSPGIGPFHDITVGNNNNCTTDPNTGACVGPVIAGYSTAPGWDPVTGLGTPVAPSLVAKLASSAGH